MDQLKTEIWPTPELKSENWPQNRLPKSEAEIMQTWESSEQPLVSVCCATYNHVRFLEDAIKGLLFQETRFPFEIIIRDDASTDGTTEIVLEYAARYPNLIRPIINSVNTFNQVKKIGGQWLGHAHGKYIALCEGDDFWITSDKLQKQIELLERHPQAVMGVAGTYWSRQDGNEIVIERTNEFPTSFQHGHIVQLEDNQNYYFHTSTFVIRKSVLSEISENYDSGQLRIGDAALRALLISFGPFVLLPEVVSVYRKTGEGIWTSLDSLAQLEWFRDTTEWLSKNLTGQFAELYRKRFPLVTLKLFSAYLKKGKFFKAVKLLPAASWYCLTSPHEIWAIIKRKLKF